MINLIQQHWYWFIGICCAAAYIGEPVNKERYHIIVVILGTVLSSVIIAIFWPFVMTVRVIARYL